MKFVFVVVACLVGLARLADAEVRIERARNVVKVVIHSDRDGHKWTKPFVFDTPTATVIKPRPGSQDTNCLYKVGAHGQERQLFCWSDDLTYATYETRVER